MDEKHDFYMEVRKLFEKKHSESQVQSILMKKGYSKKDIQEMIAEYKKDEASTKDDELITEIERRFQKKEGLEFIYEDLSQKYDPFEVKKAMLRAELVNFDYRTFFLGFMKGARLLSIFVLNILIAIFVNKWFWFLIPLLAITAALHYAYGTRNGRKLNSDEVSKELNNINGYMKGEITYPGGLFLNQGAWGWTPSVGVYPRFWLINLGVSFLILHFLLALVIFLTSEDYFAALAAVFMGILSFANLYFTHRRIV
jgi:hypothetical protein